VLRSTLPHVDGWNIWFDWYGNTPEGFAAENKRVTALTRDVGRDPAAVFRSATVFVAVGDGRSDRPHAADVEPVTGSPQEIAGRLRQFHDAGVDEAILVVSPITEESIRTLGEVVTTARDS
jgi:alkanesulfonate monooxygenase SsuD/methylene tetrahydromethanopterin reductase-like flavin-dependent oxidoreductase (luciferase family)